MCMKISETLKSMLNNGRDIYSEELELYIYLDNANNLSVCHIDKRKAVQLAELQRKSGLKWNNFFNSAARIFYDDESKKKILEYYSAYIWNDTAKYNIQKCS